MTVRACWQGKVVQGSRVIGTPTFEYAVDAERGLLLREGELFEDRPYWQREVVEIAFDEDLPPDIFEPPQDERRVAGPFPTATEVMLWRQ
jgi:hypothetical protein